MPRYLTPVKICLLVLIELYISGDIPTSVKIDVLAFIASQVVLPTDQEDVSVEDRVNLASSDITALSSTLSQWPSEIPGRSVYDKLLRSLWALTGPDSLFELFTRLKAFVTPPASEGGVAKISRFSPLGQFIRRCGYEFERLQFADAQKVWSAFYAYRLPSSSEDRVRESSVTQQVFHAEYMSTQDVDTILSLSIHQLQKQGGRIPDSVRSKLRECFEYQSEANAQSLRYFMAFFEHWRAAQMSMALESLHQYFDYSVAANRGSDNLKVYFQYAQLHQSVLYADFECWEESVNAMSECVATARENQDTACLNFALSWLLHLRQVHPSNSTSSFDGLVKLLGGSTEHDEIAFLKTKAKEGKHWSLLSSTLLEEAKLEMYKGDNLSKAFEHITQCAFLNAQHDQRSLMAAATLFESASLERLGQSRLAYMICESATLLSATHTPVSDHVRAVCRLSHIHAQMGQYASAQKMLEERLRHIVKGTVKLEDRVAAFRALAEIKRLNHQGKVTMANDLLHEVATICTGAGLEVDFEYNLLAIESLLQAGDYQQAMQNVNTLLATLKKSRMTDIAQRLHVLILKSKIFGLAKQSAKGFSLALRVAVTAQRLQLLPVLIIAVGVLSRILVDLQEFEAARDLLEASLPHALGMPDLQLRAELLACLVDAHVGIVTKSNDSSSSLKLALAYNDACCDAYAKLEDRAGTLQCLTKKILLARWRGDTAIEAQAVAMRSAILTTGEPAAVFHKAEEEAGELCI